ncbi:hypothetical protein LWI28_006354 [Acer negundo]|uniref:Alcohol dehydrogenase-like C-terminal domain-containing protein n=1 Tax=Acer negundo TaxID=4023 RepID=A0AAD5III0_ACENE|nr:hypothetical protein LWI28_002797 [Acer negundo]KAI9165033.1 hypothetical protein LWI28_006354 [Acer negundo]
MQPKKAFGWAARDTSGVLSPFTFSRRATGEKDVSFKVLYCGICHSDFHMLKNDWGTSTYPLVPGHEIVGVVTEIGSKVTVISTSPNKKKEAIEHLGADSFLVSRNQDELQAATSTMDGIIDTVSAPHALPPLIALLKTNGKLVLVGAPEKPLELPVFPLLMGRKIVAGSCIGGMKETQEMINFAAKHNIAADIEEQG